MRPEWAAPALLASLFSAEVTVAYIGVPANVIVACCLGTYSAFSVGERVTPRSRMWGLALGCVIMGAAFTAITNAGIQYARPNVEMTAGLQAGLGAAVAFCTRFFLPWLADVIKEGKWLKWIPFINKGER